MKKLFVMLLALIMCLNLAACGSANTEKTLLKRQRHKMQMSSRKVRAPQTPMIWPQWIPVM